LDRNCTSDTANQADRRHLESVTCVEPVRITTDVGQTLRVAPELTEEPACLEERVESWTGTVLQTRPTRRTGVT